MAATRLPIVKTPGGRSGPDLDAVLRKNLAALMERRNLSESELGREIGVSQQNVNRVMNGGGTSLRFVSKLCAWLGQDVGVVLALDKTDTSPTSIRGFAAHLARIATLEHELEVARWLADFAEARQQGGKHAPR